VAVLIATIPTSSKASSTRNTAIEKELMHLPTRQRATPQDDTGSRAQGARAGETPSGRPTAPRRYRLALLTWLGAYAVITPLLALLGPVMASWPLVLRTFVISVTMVGALTWLVMPRLTRFFHGWLAASA
jgi:antibiotic biosynthesis monooxygenase (ABM) superfamily enzyme